MPDEEIEQQALFDAAWSRALTTLAVMVRISKSLGEPCS